MANNVTDLGKVGITLKGEWSSATNYERLDAVTYEGSLYIAIKDNANVNPGANPTYWLLSAKHGEFTEQQLEDFKAEVVAESKEEMDDYTDDKKAELDTYEGTKETELNTYTGTKKTELDTYAGGLKDDFDSNASTKTTAFNDNATSKTNAFNTNATNKTTDFNDNATAKTTEFNTNASDKTDDFDDNVTAKTTAFDEHVEEKTEEFDANAESLQQEIDELSENMPWETTEQATEIQVTDAAKYSRNSIQLFGNTSQKSYQGYNLVDVSAYQEEEKNGVTLTKDEEGNLIFNGTATTSVAFNVSIGSTRTLTAGTYTKNITMDNNISSNMTVSIGYNNASISGTTIQPRAGIGTMTLAEDTSFDQVRIYIAAGTVFSNYKLNYMILAGEYTAQTIPNYEPYVGGVPSPNPDYPQDIHVVTGNNTIVVGDTNYPINLGSLELCKIENYQDYIYKENGNWYKYGAINKVVANNSTTFSKSTSTANTLYYRQNFVDALSNKGYCTGFIVKTVWRNDVVGCEIYNNINLRFGLGLNTNITTAEAFNEWLSNNPQTIYYIARTPTSTQITDETLIAQLDAIWEHLQLEKGTNHITVTASDLAPNMELNYMQDLKSKLDNIDSRLALLE